MASLPDNLLELVFDLIPVFGQDDFEDIFEASAETFSVGDQYKVRNELNRLCETCEKVIDLRGEVDEKCSKFLHKGRVHYLDDLAKETFSKGLELYGQYTVGIWEEVNQTGNNYRVMKAQQEQARLNAEKFEQQRKAEKLQNILATKLAYTSDNYPAHVIRFGDYLNRDEERMNYAVTAYLIFADGSEVEGVTKDLSVKGIFMRVPLSAKVELDDKVKVKLTEQLPKYKTVAPEGIEYQVKRIECIDNVIWLGLNRTYSEDEDLFSEYAEQLIGSNKFVYKVNLDNAIDAALKLGHEQVFFARTMTMALFIDDAHGQKRLRYALTSGPNEANLQFFVDDADRQYLPSIFTSAKINKILSLKTDHCLLYCFTHRVQNNLLLFAAFSFELQTDEQMKRLFVGYGSKKDSWKVFDIRKVAIDSTDAEMAFSVPSRNYESNDSDEDDEQDESESSAVVADSVDLSKLTYAFMLNELSGELSSGAYHSRGFDADLMSEITQYQINHNDGSAELKWVKYGLEELRHEPRFAYKTKAFVTFTNGMKVESTSIDFSARGVQIFMPRPVAVEKSELVYLTFPLLQKITKQLKLDQLEYRVVRTVNDQKTLFLQAVEVEEQMHHGVKFFKDLIKRNYQKLTLVSESTAQQNLTKALKNLMQKPLVTIPFYVNKVANQMRVTKLVGALEPHQLLQRLQSDEFMAKVNISVLMQHESFEAFISSFAKGTDTPAQYRTMDLFISCTEEAITVKSDLELTDKQQRQAFIEQALSEGEVYCFRVYLFGVQKVQLRKIADELEYIHHYAQHKSKYIALSLTRIVSVGELVDITDFVMDYLAIDPTSIMPAMSLEDI